MAFITSTHTAPKTRSISQRKVVQVTAVRHRYYPLRFEWHGTVYCVDAVEQCWTETQSALPWSAEWHYFWVRTQQKRFLLAHDVESGCWTCEKQG